MCIHTPIWYEEIMYIIIIHEGIFGGNVTFHLRIPITEISYFVALETCGNLEEM